MSMKANLHGRLRLNTSLPYSNGLLPLFEAVVNSIQSIDEANLTPTSGNIIVEILRERQQQLRSPDNNQKKRGVDTKAKIVGFKITDNGVGFTDQNMESFETLDSDYKADKGCRGVGRLLWLKAFEKASVSSIYKDEEGKQKIRDFTFGSQHGVGNVKNEDAPPGSNVSTTLRLDGFKGRYRESSPKTVRTIANSIFEHCLWYFVRPGSAPTISIDDDGERIDLLSVFDDHMVSSATPEKISIKEEDFDLTHIKLRTTSSNSHFIAYCAASRLVKEESLEGKISGLYRKLRDTDGEFFYACYVSSSFLDEHSRSERTGLDIEETTGNLFSLTEISLNDIRDAVVNKATDFLSDYLEGNIKKGRERVESFVSEKGPRYRPILSRIPEDRLSIDPDISDKELELILHKHLAEIEGKVLAEGHEVMNPKTGENLNEYNNRLQKYLSMAEDIKKSDLASYVSHRKVILDLLEKAIRKDEGGNYAREDLIHNLIMPMGNESNDLMPHDSNLWIVDERLAFHNYMASDKTLRSMPTTNSTETKEPDIFALNVFDNPILVSEGEELPLSSIIVIEIKRPMRNDASEGEEKDPIEQTLGYLNRIRQGGVQTSSGRLIPNSNTIPGFCYIICDLTKSMQKRCEMKSYQKTDDHLGYFGYNPNYTAYVEVISYDRLVKAAKQRNKAFFDRLGLPTT